MSYLSQINGRTIVDMYYSSASGLKRATDMYNVVGQMNRKWVKDSGGYIPEHYYIQKEDEIFLFLSENGLPIITE